MWKIKITRLRDIISQQLNRLTKKKNRVGIDIENEMEYQEEIIAKYD